MFVRFSKGKRTEVQKFFKGVVLGTNAVLEYDDTICAIATMTKETDKSYHWTIMYKSVDGYSNEQIRRKMTNMIGTSYLYGNKPKKKKVYSYMDITKSEKMFKPQIIFKPCKTTEL